MRAKYWGGNRRCILRTGLSARFLRSAMRLPRVGQIHSGRMTAPFAQVRPEIRSTLQLGRGGVISIRSRIRSMVRKVLHAARRLRSSAGLRICRIRSSRPLSPAYGYDRGTPIDRFYIETFLAGHSADIRGNVLEVGDDTYSRRFGGDRVRTQDVLHIHAGNTAATVVGDLASAGTLPKNAFDCIILTQTLQYIFDLHAAIRNLRQALRPGGVLLVTAPALSPIGADEWRDSHYWLFTPLSIERLLSSSFDHQKVTVSGLGNLYAATTFLHGAAVEEANKKKLDEVMPGYAVVICARAVA